MARASIGFLRTFTNPAFCSAATILVMVGGRTCSVTDKSLRVIGPRKTMTESAESRGPLKPLASSSFRSLRRR